MHTFFTNRFFIATFSVFLGASSMWAYDKIKSASDPIAEAPEGIFQSIISQSYDSFEEMTRMQRRLFQGFEPRGSLVDFLKYDQDGFFTSMSSTQISRREDQQNVYYDLDFGGKKATELNVDVKNGQISVFGKIEQQTQTGNSKSVFQSSFQKSFPAPPEVDAEKFRLAEENQKIVIILPKKASI